MTFFDKVQNEVKYAVRINFLNLFVSTGHGAAKFEF